ncbi:hypothetical protein ASG40_19160 [Methylobacterium sp. Leaf399]|uniref:hypothetical protein n=1 Tax=unclassified Methylobacterium TaxID=2615210 RepID=UPI000700878E|nr:MULTISPECIES: hypothetical protein [unclassified Methylobacterium]KQP54188.1 hypothetical protein ASF39_19630 [Methylobacterium sp. Leaf108]KQT14487.1 hypothetical protein ASG40_19160 [Methylobacterium sp. Leaf399]KQT78817.1 hypothetical protein ASG59_06425 [Methylobacterium sp. Leaf466]
MGSVALQRDDNVVPFRRLGSPPPGATPAPSALAARRGDQRALMDAVYATGTLAVAAGDRETKLIASRLQVYGFLVVEEVTDAGTFRRLRPSEAIRARTERPWRVSKASHATGDGPSVTIPAVDGFLFDQPA